MSRVLPLTAEAAETSSAAGVVTVEEVMELETCWYIDFPGVGAIDLEAPQLPEKVLEVAMEWMFAEPTIMETIASVLRVLHEYEHAGGFAPPAASEAAETVPEGPAAGTEPAADAPTPPPTSERRVAPLPQSSPFRNESLSRILQGPPPRRSKRSRKWERLR
jgi:hypothetical protein